VRPKGEGRLAGAGECGAFRWRGLSGGHRAGSFLKSSAANADRCLKLDDATRRFRGLVSATVVEILDRSHQFLRHRTSWSFLRRYCWIIGVCSSCCRSRLKSRFSDGRPNPRLAARRVNSSVRAGMSSLRDFSAWARASTASRTIRRWTRSVYSSLARRTDLADRQLTLRSVRVPATDLLPMRRIASVQAELHVPQVGVPRYMAVCS